MMCPIRSCTWWSSTLQSKFGSWNLISNFNDIPMINFKKLVDDLKIHILNLLSLWHNTLLVEIKCKKSPPADRRLFHGFYCALWIILVSFSHTFHQFRGFLKRPMTSKFHSLMFCFRGHWFQIWWQLFQVYNMP